MEFFEEFSEPHRLVSLLDDSRRRRLNTVARGIDPSLVEADPADQDHELPVSSPEVGDHRLTSLRVFLGKHRKLQSVLADLLEDFGLVGYQALNITDKESVIAITRSVDRANGYAFGVLHDGSDSAVGAVSTEWGGSAVSASAAAPMSDAKLEWSAE
jgi:hypothetical protein